MGRRTDSVPTWHTFVSRDAKGRPAAWIYEGGAKRAARGSVAPPSLPRVSFRPKAYRRLDVDAHRPTTTTTTTTTMSCALGRADQAATRATPGRRAGFVMFTTTLRGQARRAPDISAAARSDRVSRANIALRSSPLLYAQRHATPRPTPSVPASVHRDHKEVLPEQRTAGRRLTSASFPPHSSYLAFSFAVENNAQE